MTMRFSLLWGHWVLGSAYIDASQRSMPMKNQKTPAGRCWPLEDWRNGDRLGELRGYRLGELQLGGDRLGELEESGRIVPAHRAFSLRRLPPRDGGDVIVWPIPHFRALRSQVGGLPQENRTPVTAGYRVVHR